MPSAAAMRPCRVADYRPGQGDNQTGRCDFFHCHLHPAPAEFLKVNPGIVAEKTL
jgi:hypothetical protein